MDCETRSKVWSFLIFIQDGSIAAIMAAVFSFLLGVDDLIEFGIVYAVCFLIVKSYHRMAWGFFSGLTNNRLLRKYLFGNNAKQ
tara:strand:- start:314 stop:565 length:252 start_codon:yes stop_codon:yes gene_type:complete